MGDHTGRQQNHIWAEAEIADVRENMWKHKPDTFSDHVANRFMRGLYVAFNYITGYRHDNPTPASIGWRLMVLESVAGVPGFLAAAVRHFRSLRTMRDDHGWINSLLEEAENERMHLIVCIRVFEASYVTRALVLAAQCVMTPFLLSVYLLHPKIVHRFVGYLEETAVHTYNNIIDHCERPGTLLHTAWKDVPAPEIAKAYWKLHDNAMLVDALKCMCADEANHRDVNHTFAAMRGDDPNPFLMAHKHDASIAWRLENQGAHAWESKTVAIGTPTASTAPSSKSAPKPAL
jgi:hypothetical protein